LLFPTISQAQLVLQNQSIQFNSTFETGQDSAKVKIYNQGLANQHITGYKNYNTYLQSAFSMMPSSASILAGDSAEFTFYFKPRHNVNHNSEIIIFTDDHRGTLRIDVKGQGKYFLPYYNSSENLEEQALKDALKTRTGLGYVSLGYSNARTTMFSTIDNWFVNGRGAANDKMECVYTGRIVENYPFVPGSLVNAPYSINTEHTFPQSLFSQAEPMRSDLHHLFPTDEAVNNSRGDNPMAEVTNPTGSNGGSIWTGSNFEPRDVHKGNAARAMFYFVLRYQNYNNYLNSQEAVLRTWHTQFPPTSVDIKRNEDINGYQFNRNPFVDYPQFLERITSMSTNSVAPVLTQLDFPEDTIDFDTVNGSAVYMFHVVNSGNQVLNLDQFNVNHPEITLIFPSAVNLNPGEAHLVQVMATPTGNIQTALTFTSNGTNVSIPILVKSLTARIKDQYSNIRIFPNPGNDQIQIQGIQVQNWKMCDISGKIVLQGNSSNIDSSTLTKGSYFLFINDEVKGISWIKN